MEIVRPYPPRVAPSGFRYEAEVAGNWRVATAAEQESRPCRHSPRKPCPNRVVAALNRGQRRRDGSRADVWWFYCPEHMYGRWVEDGKVLDWRLVRDES